MNNQNDFNNNSNNQVDPSFLPKDSNVYVRTMNSDLNNLKNQGGEALPYSQDAANINIPKEDLAKAPPVAENMPTTQNFPPENYSQPKPIESFSSEANVANPNMPVPQAPMSDLANQQPAPAPDLSSINLSPDNHSLDNQNMPQNQADNLNPYAPSNNEIPQNNNFENIVPTADNIPNPNISPTVETPYSGFNANNLNESKNIHDIKTSENTNNLSADLNNLITPEEFSPIANVNPNDSKPEGKNKLLIPVIFLAVLALIIMAYLIVWPRFFRPKVSLETNNNNHLLTPATTPTTTKPNPFLMVSNNFVQSNLTIDISKSAEITKQIVDEAKTLGSPQSFKIITPKIKDQFLSSQDILNLFIQNAPDELTNNLQSKYLIYAYYGEFKPALGIVFSINQNNVEAVKRSFMSWEVNRDIIKNTLNMWLFTPKASRATMFKETELLGASVRFFEYPENEVGFTYAFYENNLIITTSIESANAALIQIQNPTTSVIQ